MTTTPTTEIPLNKLVPFAGNVRKTKNKSFIAKLAASIRAHGLQQNLIVRKKAANYEVVGGGQRYAALLLLRKQGDIAANYRVTCKVDESGIDPVELSLAENVMRDDMHPADQFEAFRNLVDKGLSVADIAARFGASETHVRQLLKLAQVSAAVMKAYREGKLSLEQVKAFAVSDDHAAQDAVLANLRPHQRDPRTIRDALTENEVCATDRRVKFVGVKAYEKAGGKTRTDMFSEGPESVFLLDAALLDRLAQEKLDRAKLEIAKEGWKWTDAFINFTYEVSSQFRQIHAEAVELPRKVANEVEKLEAEYQKLEAEWEEAGEDAEYPERCEAIRERLDQIEENRETAWKPEQLAMAGAVVCISREGKLDFQRGLIRPEDMPKTAKGKQAAAAANATEADEEKPGLSAALTESLSAQRSAALAVELAANPGVALAAVVHGMASRIFFDVYAEDCALQIAAHPQSLHRVEGSKASERMEAERKQWSEVLPKSVEGLWTWCLTQKQDMLLKLLAFCAGATVNAVQGKFDKPESKRLRNAEALAIAVKLDMTPWFTPDAPNYFSRVSTPQILDALKEGRQQPNAPAWEKLKKAELAALAERELAGKGWLPELLRRAA